MSDLDASATDALPAWRERKNLLLAGAVGVAILLLGGYFLLSGGSSDEDLGPVPSAANRGGNPVATAAPTPTPVATLPEESNDDVFNDPFAPIYPARATAAAAPAPSIEPAVQTDTGNGATTTGGVSVPVPQAPVVTADPAPTKKKVTTLQLVRVPSATSAVVRVNGGPEQAVSVDTSFGTYFVLTGTLPDENTASFTYGSVEFDLSKGETRKFS